MAARPSEIKLDCDGCPLPVLLLQKMVVRTLGRRLEPPLHRLKQNVMHNGRERDLDS